MIRIITKFSVSILLILTALPLADLAYCRFMLFGAVDADMAFEHKEGVVYLKGIDVPFSGKAYQTVCGDECGIFGCYSIHWKGSYTNGYRNGIFYSPKSDRSDDYFKFSLFNKEYKKTEYTNGQINT